MSFEFHEMVNDNPAFTSRSNMGDEIWIDCNFALFHKMKLKLKGCCLDITDEIQMNRKWHWRL